jgi:hypothetical protein
MLQQPMGQLVSPCIEPGIRQALTLVLHRHHLRCALGLLLEQLMDQCFLRIRRFRGIEPVNDLIALIITHDLY